MHNHKIDAYAELQRRLRAEERHARLATLVNRVLIGSALLFTGWMIHAAQVAIQTVGGF